MTRADLATRGEPRRDLYGDALHLVGRYEAETGIRRRGTLPRPSAPTAQAGADMVREPPVPPIAVTARKPGDRVEISGDWPHPTQWLDGGDPDKRRFLEAVRSLMAAYPDFRIFLYQELMGNEPMTGEEARQIADNLRQGESDLGFGTRFHRP